MAIASMMGQKECGESGQTQLFQQFNLQADRDRLDLIFDIVNAIARIPGRAGTQYLKTGFDNFRDSLDNIVTLAQNFGFGKLSHSMQDVKFYAEGNGLSVEPSIFQRLLRVREQSLFALWDMPIYS